MMRRKVAAWGLGKLGHRQSGPAQAVEQVLEELAAASAMWV